MKQILLLILILSLSLISYSQGKIKKKRTLNEDVFMGGNIGLMLGDYTGIEVSPFIGYKFVDNLYTATKLTYMYMKNTNANFESEIYGASIFAEYVFYDKIVGHAELQSLKINTLDKKLNNNEKYWFTAPILGGGLYQKLGDRSALMFMVLFDVSGSAKSIYNNPIIHISFLF